MLTIFSFSISLHFALSSLSTQSTESSPAVFVLVVYWWRWMGYAEHKLKEITAEWNERKKTPRLRLMTVDGPFIYCLTGPITESEPTVHQHQRQ